MWKSSSGLLVESEDVLERHVRGINGNHDWAWGVGVLNWDFLTESATDLHAISVEFTEIHAIKHANNVEFLDLVALLNLVINDINGSFVSGGFTNGPVGWVSKLRNTSLSEFNALDLVLDIIHGDFVHAGRVGFSSVDNSSVVSSLALVIIGKVVRGLHLEHEVTIHVEWIMSDGEDVFSAQSLNGVAHFLWKDKSVVDPGNFDRNLLVINWVRTTSVAETKFDSRDVVIKEVFTVSELQAQNVGILDADTALLTSGRVALDVDHGVIRKNRLINSDVHGDQRNEI